jgi:hypothetical protein
MTSKSLATRPVMTSSLRWPQQTDEAISPLLREHRVRVFSV